MNPDILPNLITGASLALGFLLIGIVAGIFIGIKLEDRYDLSDGDNYRRKGK